jgi:hypothetical protein
VEGKGIQQREMEEAPENGKESSHSPHANGINECMNVQDTMIVCGSITVDLVSMLPAAFSVLGLSHRAGTLTELCLAHNDAGKAQPQTIPFVLSRYIGTPYRTPKQHHSESDLLLISSLHEAVLS